MSWDTRWSCDYTGVQHDRYLPYHRAEPSGEQGTENEGKKREKKERETNFSLAAVTYSLRSWVGSASIIPHINNPNSDWLVSPRRAATWLPTGQRSGVPLQEGGGRREGHGCRWGETPRLLPWTTLYNSRLKRSRSPFLYCMLGRGQGEGGGHTAPLPTTRN